jgi:YVTN family beta-propeller protein
MGGGSFGAGELSVIDFRVLGSFEVLEDQQPLALGGPKQRALLALLLLRRGETVSSDRLIDALWGERAPASAVKIVQGYVSNLRRLLGDGVLVTRGHGYALQTKPGQVDLERFEALVSEGRRLLQTGDARAGRQRLRDALALWRGEPLADLSYEPFAQSEIARLEEARLAALEDRIDADLSLGDSEPLVAELEALVHEHPLRERLRGQLMLALYRSGRQADALESYRNARATLVNELGIEPGPALQHLERAILAHDPALEAPSQGPVRQPATIARGGRPGGLLVVAAGAVLLAAIVLAAVKLPGSGAGYVQVAPNSVAVIDVRSNRLVASVPVGARPGAIAFGSGSLWVANVDDQNVSRIDPGSLRTLGVLSLADPPTGLAAGSNAIWVVQSNPTASSVSVNSIDPQFDTVGPTERLGNVVAGGPGAVAAQDATVWVAPSSGLLTELDVVTRRPVEQIDPNSGPAAIGVGDGAVWVTDSEADNVTRVDPTRLLTPITVGNGPTGIAVDDRGVWVADSLDDAVVRIDPITRSVTTTIPVGRSPTGIAVGAGSVWVANSGDGTVTRIDPSSGKVLATIAVGGSPQAITIASGRAWVTVDAQTIQPTDLAASGGTLRMDAPYDVDSMDPALAYTSLSQQLLYATCAKLLNNPDKPGAAGAQLTAEVAQSLPARSVDGRTYTFTIRSGFRFSPPSNKPVTAQTFKDTIERTLNPRMQSPVAQDFLDIVGAGAYMAGKAPHVSGVVARGDTLTIRLLSPAPDFLSRIALPAMCAVPSDTPIDPQGVRVIPSAGPYYVASYTPGQGVVLVRNPNYRGGRPHRVQQIDLAMGISELRALADVEAGTADYRPLGGPGPTDVSAVAAQLAARYGPGSPAGARGGQQYFVNPQLTLSYLYLNTHRPLFSDVRLRQAVNYAIDRRALAQLGTGTLALPERPTDHYLPPGMPGSTSARTYPLTPDLPKANSLAKGRGRTAVLYTCENPICAQQAQIVKNDLAAIGLQVKVKEFPIVTLQTVTARPREPFDLAAGAWGADYPDPSAILEGLIENGLTYPTFDDPTYRRRLADTARLSGPERYLAYSKLDVDLALNAAPLVAFGNPASHDFFSARIGCQTYGFYGMDLAALCIKHRFR